MSKKRWVTLAVILIVIILSIIILTRSHPETTEDIAKCIASKSMLYTQLGCHACEHQEELFGENYQYLNVVDCFFEREKCLEKNIRATPTWIINEKEYVGSRSIEQLKEIAGC